MANTFNDDYTSHIRMKMEDFEQVIYDIEDKLFTLGDKESEIIAYLNDKKCSISLGLMLRRYLCGKFADNYTEEAEGITFTLDGGKVITVTNYRQEDYDISTGNVSEFADICVYLNEKYNKGSDGRLLLDIKRSEFVRLLKLTTECTRAKLFELSFALHMDSEELSKFLTDALAEQTYNFRKPEEIVAFYCHTHEEVNNYADYLRIMTAWQERLKGLSPSSVRENYTWYARLTMEVSINTEDELMAFMTENAANFNGYSETAYREFMQLYSEALERSSIQQLSVSGEEYLHYESRGEGHIGEMAEQVNKAISINKVSNTEQLAKVLLEFIPRVSTKKVTKSGKTIVENDFTTIYNGEGGSGKKKITTSLPKSITVNLPMKDRLDDLITRKKPVDRKDLVFFKFYVFSRDLEDKGEYSAADYRVFMDECNDLLVRCGMSRLYPANRFENLILLSLVSQNPFETFGDIIEASFVEKGFDEDGAIGLKF